MKIIEDKYKVDIYPFVDWNDDRDIGASGCVTVYNDEAGVPRLAVNMALQGVDYENLLRICAGIDRGMQIMRSRLTPEPTEEMSKEELREATREATRRLEWQRDTADARAAGLPYPSFEEWEQRPVVTDSLLRDMFPGHAVPEADRPKPDLGIKPPTEQSWNEKRQRLHEQWQQEKEEKARAHEAERQAKMTIHWNEDGKAVCDLFEAVAAAADLEMDSRYLAQNWIKEVSGIDATKKDGRMYQGALVRKGTVEVERGYRVYLVAATSGSRKHQTTTYRAVVMLPDGTLEATDSQTDSRKAGWALRLRDDIQGLLDVPRTSVNEHVDILRGYMRLVEQRRQDAAHKRH